MTRCLRPLAWLAVALSMPLLATGSEVARVGRQVAEFELADHHGRKHALSNLADGKQAVVVAFLGVECPLAKLYAPRLQELASQYESKGVAFVGICSNRQDAPTEIEGYVTQHGIKFPVLKDRDNAVADDFQASRTPEVFVLDAQRNVLYAGRIDDQYGLENGSGYAKSAVHRRDLIEALEEVLASKPVSEAETVATGCLIGRVSKVTPHGDVTYTNQVARILQNRCVECHRAGEVAPFALTSYDEVVGWGEMMREVVDNNRMPPWFADPKHGHFSNDRRLSDEEKQTLSTWVENGCPEGDAADLPPAREFVEGWQIGEPDAVFYATESPVDVPAEGVMDYEYLTVDPKFTEDKWIQAAEARPGNRQVVHHIIVFFEKPGKRGGTTRDGGQIGYAPGMQPRKFEPGTAIKVPAGSKLVFQMHYTPNGSPQKDRSCVGFKFVDAKSVVREIHGSMAGNMSFKIPPFADNHQVTATKKFRKETVLLSMLPHMHLRGKAFRFDLAYPDGRKEVLLDVPDYDFNWQLWYHLAEPKLIPKGAKMTVTAHFDNSADNPFNPDPGAEVTWGEQTFEEMMFGFFTTMDPNENLQAGASTEDQDKDEDDDLSGNAAF